MKIPFHHSTRARLILFVLLVAVPAFLVQVFGAWYDLQQAIAAGKQDAKQIVVRGQNKFETMLDTSRTVFSDLVRLPDMRNPDNCSLVFNDLHLSYERLAPDATNIGLTDANGSIYCAINPVQGERSIAHQSYFDRAKQTLDISLGDYSINPVTGLPNLSIAYPVLSFDGKVQTIIFITYQLRWLENWQKEVALPPGTALTLISPDGTILQRYLNGTVIPTQGSAAQTQWYQPLLNGQDGVEVPDLDGVTRLHTLASLRLGTQSAAWLHLGFPVAEIYTKAEQALAWKLALLGIVFLVALALAWWESEVWLLRPLNGLMRVVEQIQRGDLTTRAGSFTAVGELSGLAQAFNRMAESLQSRETARQKAQMELLKSEARFRAMFENSAVVIGLMALDRKIIDSNPAMCAMLGRTREELIGITPAVVTYQDDYVDSTEKFNQLISGETTHYISERRYVHKDGTVFWAQVSMSIVSDSNGTPLYLVGLINNIDAQKQAQARLAEQESEYRRTLEQRVEERTHELAEANLRLVEEIEQRKRVEEALAAKAAEDAVASERTRLARDLHDAVTQTLFSASLIAEVLPDLWAMDVDEAKKSTEELRQLTRGALAEMRTLLLELRPAALTQSRLSDLIRQLCEALTGRGRLPITLMMEGERLLPPEVQVAFYRIAQESLNNVFKYARATQVNVSLYLTSTGVHLNLCDNGIGFDMASIKPTSLGMRIMHERAEAVGADLSINGKPGSGVSVEVVWNEKPDMKLSVFKN